VAPRSGHAYACHPPDARDDLKQALEAFTRVEALSAGCILSGIGSLSAARLRMPGALGEADAVRTFDGPMEIVSLAGTLSPDGLHVHVSLAGRDGACVGGHLVPGCIVHTTAELVIGELTDVAFRAAARPGDGVRRTPRRAVALRRGPGSEIAPPCFQGRASEPGAPRVTRAGRWRQAYRQA
jgi:predicted DNA-binding protein with PD1-like motif